jgi:hypothetical protein
MLDVTECEIQSPTLYEWEYYSSKSKTHTLKYEVGISMKTHKIVWINGPYKGSIHDLSIARDKVYSQMKIEEKALCDKGYIGGEKSICPFKPAKTDAQKQFNLKHYSVRQSVERTNLRFKKFNVLNSVWKGKDFSIHAYLFKAIAIIIQLDFQDHPLTKQT